MQKFLRELDCGNTGFSGLPVMMIVLTRTGKPIFDGTFGGGISMGRCSPEAVTMIC